MGWSRKRKRKGMRWSRKRKRKKKGMRQEEGAEEEKVYEVE